jgi:predicted nucleic acid-binding protein
MLVVDASFAITAALTSEGLERLRGRDAVAPALLWSEAFSVLHEMAWRGEISTELAEASRARLGTAPIRLRRLPRLYSLAGELATQFGWAKTYDAEYVALARLLDCPLLTVDEKLARTAARQVTVLAPASL